VGENYTEEQHNTELGLIIQHVLPPVDENTRANNYDENTRANGFANIINKVVSQMEEGERITASNTISSFVPLDEFNLIDEKLLYKNGSNGGFSTKRRFVKRSRTSRRLGRRSFRKHRSTRRR
jgi:hypothetical protein